MEFLENLWIGWIDWRVCLKPDTDRVLSLVPTATVTRIDATIYSATRRMAGIDVSRMLGEKGSIGERACEARSRDHDGTSRR